MPLYDRFAAVYQRGPYPGYSLRMAELLPSLLLRINYHPVRLLDLACGEGSFAVTMAHQGMQVTGLDRSAAMLALARQRASTEGVEINWVVADMTAFSFSPGFHLVTCWFDSLNYVLELAGLRQVFSGVQRALRPGGLFIFDMNTIYGLAVGWTSQPTYIQQTSPELLELHRTQFDYDRLIARVTITVFQRQGEVWTRFDEEHLERGYPVEEVQACLEENGLQVLGIYGSLLELGEVKLDSGRAWFVAQKR